jgi:hypothetical protein
MRGKVHMGLWWRTFGLLLALAWLVMTIIQLLTGHADSVEQSVKDATKIAADLRIWPLRVLFALLLGWAIYRLARRRSWVHLSVLILLAATLQVRRLVSIPDRYLITVVMCEVLVAVALDLVVIAALWRERRTGDGHSSTIDP